MTPDYKSMSVSLSLTDRDVAMLGDLARFRVLTAEQLRRRHFSGRAPSTTWNRLNKLKAGGYVTRVGMGYGQGAVWLLTAQGAALSGTGLPAPRGTSASWPAQWYRHHLTVADVAQALLTKAAAVAPASWLTEAEWCREQRPWPTGNNRPDGVLRLSPPDGTVHALAVEVELGPKPARAYATKLRWYRQQLAAGAFQRVRWYCGDDLTLRHIQTAVAAASLSAMETRPLAPLLAELAPLAA